MPNAFTHHLDRRLAGDEDRGHGVARGLWREVVGQSRSLRDRLEVAPQHPLRKRRAGRVGEDKAVILPQLPCLQSRLKLALALGRQDREQRLSERQRALAVFRLRLFQISVVRVSPDDVLTDAQRLRLLVEVRPFERQQLAGSETDVERQLE